jgi:hypothetical protein
LNLKNIKNNLHKGFDRCFNRVLVLAKKIWKFIQCIESI